MRRRFRPEVTARFKKVLQRAIERADKEHAAHLETLRPPRAPRAAHGPHLSLTARRRTPTPPRPYDGGSGDAA
jgi:hypothetical protein